MDDDSGRKIVEKAVVDRASGVYDPPNDAEARAMYDFLFQLPNDEPAPDV